MTDRISIRRISVSDSLLAQLRASTARRFHALPISLKNDLLVIAVSPEVDPIDAVDAVEAETGLSVDYRVAENHDDLIVAIRRYYPDDREESASTAEGLFNRILNRSLQQRASDIHICPDDEGATVQLRIDGAMWTDRRLDANAFAELSAVIKINAELDNAEKRTPQDGSINMFLGGVEISLRVATIPTIYGEHITLRLLSQDHGEELERVDSLGMSEQHRMLFLEALSEPNGIILLSGPTGSGKTTTLYAALRHLSEKRTKHLISIEDPVEKPVDGVTQIKIDSDGDRLTFHKALRSVLRHDPDVIMIGEIRDGETGDIAVKSALTGHLTFGTLHTSEALQTITRLIGSFPANEQEQIRVQLATTLNLVISQQLVPWNDGKGRSLAAEIMVGTPAIKAMIRESKIHQIASAIQTGQQSGMKSMNASLYELLKSGRINEERALEWSLDKEDMKRMISSSF